MAVHARTADRVSPTRPAGEGKGAWLATLEQGAHLLQDTSPAQGFDVYVVGCHCAKGEPGFQMEAHHYCRVVNDDLLQCVLFDGNTRQANLIGVEYIVSGRLFDGLPEHEKGYWHPHNFELLSGQLVAPGLPEAAEREFLSHLVNSYGKTWHTWHTNPATGTRRWAWTPRAGARSGRASSRSPGPSTASTRCGTTSPARRRSPVWSTSAPADAPRATLGT